MEFEFSLAFLYRSIYKLFSGLSSNKIFNEFIKKEVLKYFAIYRVLLGLLVYIVYFVR